MKLQQLRYLLAIADNDLNITAASERLFTSQPGVSKQLKLLEEELGMQLFIRRGKSLGEITPAGREVIERARIIMREVENIGQMAANLREDTSGNLSIGTTHTQARYVLPPVVKAFSERYPDVTLDLHQGTSEQIADMVKAKEIDFTIASGSTGLFKDLVVLPCFQWDRIILVPRDHELAELDGKLELEELARHPLITYVFSFTGKSSLKRAFEEHGLTPRVVFTARDADVIKTYVRMGMGVGVVASMAHECNDLEDLVAIDASGLFPRSTTWIGFRRDAVLRGYMFEFAELFAPHVTPSLAREAAVLPDQEAINRLCADIELPLRGACKDDISAV